MNIEDYRYFICVGGIKKGWSTSEFVVLNKRDNGIVVDKNCVYVGWTPSYGTNWINPLLSSGSLKETTLEECLTRINKYKNLTRYNNLFKRLEIRPINNSVKITEENKNLIISILKDARAFNGDSAHDFKGKPTQEICCELADQKIIKTLDYNKFWIEEEENKIEVKEDVKLIKKETV